MSDFVAGDNNSVLPETVRTKAGVPVDLTGYTATLRWRYSPNGPMVKQASMVLANQTTNPGEVYYRWLAGELVAPTIIYDIVVREVASGRLVTQIDEVTLFIRAKAEDPDTSASPSASRSPSSSFSASPSSSVSASPSASPSSSQSPSSSVSASPSSSGSASPSSTPSASPSSSPSASPSAS